MKAKRDKEIQSFGTALRQYRQKAKLSQEEVAHRAGLDRTYVGSVERGERNISLKNIHLLAQTLDTTASELLGVAEKIELDYQW